MTPARLVDLDAVHLDRGSHSDWESGACVMELAAYIAGEEWSDHPACVTTNGYVTVVSPTRPPIAALAALMADSDRVYLTDAGREAVAS